jgi:soluble lytic murein transglycosylase-like protein
MATDIFDEIFKKYGDMYGVSPDLLKAQAIAESNLNPLARNAIGSAGIAQIMPDTFDEWSKKLGLHHANVYNPDDAIHVQAGYMAYLQQKVGGDWTKALAAYNWGLRHVSYLVAHVGDTDWMNHLPDETSKYIERILKSLGI